MITTAPAFVIRAPRYASKASPVSVTHLGDARDSSIVVGEDSLPSASQRCRERDDSALTRGREEGEGREPLPGLRDCPHCSAAARVDPLGAIPAIGPEDDRTVPRDHGQAMEPAPTAAGVGDRRDSSAVAREDAAHSVRGIRAEGNGARLVHGRTKRADGRESAVSVRHHLQAAVSEEKHALTAPRKFSVEARVPRVIEVGMARDACVERSPHQFLDPSAGPGEDPRAADPKRRLECDDTSVVDGRDVGRELAEPLAGGRDHGKREHQKPTLRALSQSRRRVRVCAVSAMGAPGIEPGTSRV